MFLAETFLAKYAVLPCPMSTIGEVTYWRTYSRNLWEAERKEQWWETVARVVEGTFAILYTHCQQHNSSWNQARAERTAREMYDRIYHFKFTPPGRGLYAMGTEAHTIHGAAVLNNCGFLSTKVLDAKVFAKLMDLTMLGVGVGYDTLGSGVIHQPYDYTPHVYTIPDTREGWVHSVQWLLDSYLTPSLHQVNFNYSNIRKAGMPIKRFGGISSGAGPLRQLHQSLRLLCDSYINKPVDSEWIVDCANLIGRCVVSGNVRRSAQIALGESTDTTFLQLKTDIAKVTEYRAFSNNSVLAHIGMDYSYMSQLTAQYGEPGYLWLDNCRAYGRMNGQAPSRTDFLVAGTNPCQPSWATVLTPHGISIIGNIQVGDTIWSGYEWTTITNKVATGIKPVKGYHTHAGAFYGTEHHKVFQYGLRCDAKEAIAIDTIQGPSPTYFPVQAQDIMDGLVLGDGSAKQGKYVLLYIGEDDSYYHESEIEAYIQSRFDKTAWRVKTTLTPAELPYTYVREVPPRFFYGNDVVKRGFLRGLFSANGSFVGGQRVTLKSTSYRLIEQVQVMLSSLGIRSYYTSHEPKNVQFGDGLYECRKRYDINITVDAHLFSMLIGFIHPYKQDKLDCWVNRKVSKYARKKPKTTYEIIEVSQLGEEIVYDITVASGRHSYWTGGLLVSNCSEQSLEDNELCCLVETYPAHHRNLDDYFHTLKLAYLYAKSVTLLKTGFEETDAIITRNRRIGCSMSGVTQAIQKLRASEFFRWCDRGYDSLTGLDASYSDWLKVPESIKRTSVKPSGTVSILANASPGIHYPHAEYYIRRIRIQSGSQILPTLEAAGYTIVPDTYGQERGKENTMVVEFPVHEPHFLKGKQQATMFEQLALAAMMQKYWADNQVSITVHFTKEEARDIPLALEIYQHHLKSVSFLPYDPHKLYALAPYEEITKEDYGRRIGSLQSVRLPYNCLDSKPILTGGCDSDTCEIVGPIP